jgi:hypothetical protein
MQNNRVLCYSIKVEIPTEAGQRDVTYYLVRTSSEQAALSAIREHLPANWQVAEINPAAVRTETVEALGLLPGVPHQI